VRGVTLLTSIREHRVSDTMVRFSPAGELDGIALVNAVLDRYAAVLDREPPSRERLEELAGEKVTLVRKAESLYGAGMIVADEGRLGTLAGGGLGLLPKGAKSRGFRVDPDRVLDVLDGWDVAEAQRLVDVVRDRFPKLQPLTQERLSDLPSGRAATVSLAVFGTHPGFPGTGRCADAVWLIGSYDAEDDILDDSVLLIRPEVGVSEHGSSYGRDLLRLPVGEVVGFEPIPFAEAVRLCDVDHDEALDRLFGRELTSVGSDGKRRLTLEGAEHLLGEKGGDA
jgi:hypothetical protein